MPTLSNRSTANFAGKNSPDAESAKSPAPRGLLSKTSDKQTLKPSFCQLRSKLGAEMAGDSNTGRVSLLVAFSSSLAPQNSLDFSIFPTFSMALPSYVLILVRPFAVWVREVVDYSTTPQLV